MPTWDGPYPLKGQPGQSIPGQPGEDGEDGLSIIGPPGKDGAAGGTGPPGKDGNPGSPGLPGAIGRDGQTVQGQDGEDGQDGISIQGPPGLPSTIPGPMGQPIPGDVGEDGQDGYSVQGPPGLPSTIPGPMGQSIPGEVGEDGQDGINIQGQPGLNAFTTTTVAFVTPVLNVSTAVVVASIQWMYVGQNLQILSTSGSVGMVGTILSISGSTVNIYPITLVIGTPGSTVPIGSVVIITSPQGPTGNTGATGQIIYPQDGEDGQDGHTVIGPTGPASTIQGPPGYVIPSQDGEDGQDGHSVQGPSGPVSTVQGPPGYPIPGSDGEDGQDGAPVVGQTGVAGSIGATGGATLLSSNTTVPAGNTIANTAVETAFTSSYSPAANYLVAGDVIRVMARLVYSAGVVVPTLTLKIKWGSTLMLTTGALTVANVSNDFIEVNGDFIIQSIGAGGTVDAQGDTELGTAATAALIVGMTNTAAISIDTTSAGALAITMTATWSGASASNTVTLRQFRVEKLSVSGSPGSGTVTSVATSGLATGGTFTGSGTVTVTAAVKSDQTTGSSTSVAVVPAIQQNHDSAIKAWVKFSVAAGVVTVNASYNVTSVTRTGAGAFTITWTTGFTTANYGISVLQGGNAAALSAYAAAPALTTTTAKFVTANTAGALVDPVDCSVNAFGVQ